MADQSRRLQQELRRLQRNVNRVARGRRFQTVALKTIEGLLKTRVFTKGIATNGSKIGQYSTKDILIGASSFRSRGAANKVLGSKAKRRDLDWVTIGGRRLAILEGGYKKLREEQGLESNFVNLEYNSDLRKSIQVGTSGSGVALGFINDEQANIAGFNEDRFKKQIFTLSASEEKEIDRAIIREFNAILNQTFR